ncbi:MAG: hypothetical protein BWY09_00822 [Candidatus Hydrogenedentes bacterium ADurb.Bin179]|nr:MAG: hypothetical protein BWY09_00822 [Candidatus Hydrogenedentes bacterium ADurb.Bin179]
MGKQFGERTAQVSFNRGPHQFKINRGHFIQQAAEFFRYRVTDKVGARAQYLAQFNKRRSQFRQRLAQAAAESFTGPLGRRHHPYAL